MVLTCTGLSLNITIADSSGLPVMFPPPEPQVPDDGHWRKSQVKDTCIHPFCGLLPKLLGGPGADRALCIRSIWTYEEKKTDQ